MPNLSLSPKTIEQAAEVGQGFGWRSTSAAIERIVATFHQAYAAADMPDGWELKDALVLGDLEAYFETYEKEEDGNAWHQRGRSIRAAIAAGWIVKPDGLTVDAVAGLTPSQATQLKNAIDAFYTNQTVPSPNSSGPSLDT